MQICAYTIIGYGRLLKMSDANSRKQQQQKDLAPYFIKLNLPFVKKKNFNKQKIHQKQARKNVFLYINKKKTKTPKEKQTENIKKVTHTHKKHKYKLIYKNYLNSIGTECNESKNNTLYFTEQFGNILKNTYC